MFIKIDAKDKYFSQKFKTLKKENILDTNYKIPKPEPSFLTYVFGAVQKVCKACGSQQIGRTEYFVLFTRNIGFDTSENEASKKSGL